MSVGHQITDGYALCTKSRPPLCRLCCDQAGMVEWNSTRTVYLSDVVHIKPKVSETYGRAGHCKQPVQGPSNTLHTCSGIGQCHTPPFHWLYSIHWWPGAMGCTLQAGLNTVCGPLLWGPVPQMKEGRKELWMVNMIHHFMLWYRHKVLVNEQVAHGVWRSADSTAIQFIYSPSLGVSTVGCHPGYHTGRPTGRQLYWLYSQLSQLS